MSEFLQVITAGIFTFFMFIGINALIDKLVEWFYKDSENDEDISE